MDIHPEYQWKKLTPDDGEYFFGYYDRNPWNHDQTLHLAMRIPQGERLPVRGETAEIGVIGKDGYRPLTATRAWCHQQGCMELFLPRRPGCFIYNDYDEKDGKLVARIFRIGEGVVGRFELPVYAISPDGRWGVSLNFARIPRRGYSYADAVLPEDLHPADLDADGLWLVDLDSGETKLIVSYRTMIERHPFSYGLDGRHIWMNHAIFNCDSTRLLWLFRQCDTPHNMRNGWQTFMYTCSLDGADAECVLPENYWRGQISHQIWGRTPREILVDANWTGRGHGAIVFDESRRPFLASQLSTGHGRMAHMVCSPDGRYILADSYPDAEHFQTLILIDAESGKWEPIGRFRHEQPPECPVEVRCDIHPRWSPDGRLVTVDSIHSGRRAVYLLDLAPVFEKWKEQTPRQK